MLGGIYPVRCFRGELVGSLCFGNLSGSLFLFQSGYVMGGRVGTGYYSLIELIDRATLGHRPATITILYYYQPSPLSGLCAFSDYSKSLSIFDNSSVDFEQFYTNSLHAETKPLLFTMLFSVRRRGGPERTFHILRVSRRKPLVFSMSYLVRTRGT